MTRVLIALLLAGLAPARPQPAEESGERFDTERFRQRVRNALNLTETQETSLRDLRAALERKVEAVRRQIEEGVMTPEEGRQRFRRALRAHTAGRDRILSEDQREFLARAREFIEERMLAAPPGRLKAGFLVDTLKLTEDQQRLWLDLLQRHRARYAEGEASGLADSGGLLEEQRKAFEAMLTVEQQLELERIRAGWHGEKEEAADTTGVGIEQVDPPPPPPLRTMKRAGKRSNTELPKSRAPAEARRRSTEAAS